ncbi:hypothetical protein LAU42_11535 [Macrococcus armenti]|uniref:hypothetical protein n=1 Tax=Macrococcus armenti TaxID=2875764 RepID=UPI001CCD326F|nr:hypothetical protein [Macrococcus armenti]UBH22325.1 hypothetical protein LAU42_11535 [Macrococcus armenti]
MNNKPILAHMKNHFNRQPISLHVPGHHYNTIGRLDKLDFCYDVTEIEGMDDYHHPETIIKDSQYQLSRHVSYISKFLVGGTTSGIVSSILGIFNHRQLGGYPIAVMRNAHKSIINAIQVAGVNAYILPTKVSNITHEYSSIDLLKIDETILKDIHVAVLTYPNYYGETYNIEEIINFFRERNIITIIDEAHGAHFDITPQFPESSLQFGADVVIQSYHKTLPAFTMSSVIHIKEDNKYKDAILRMLSILQSSSPSYLLMLGLEHAQYFYKTYEDKVFFYQRAQLIEKLKEKNLDVSVVDDPLKLVVYSENDTGFQLSERLCEHGIYTELSNEKFVLLVLPLWHNGDRYPFDDLLKRVDSMQLPHSEFVSSNGDLLLKNTEHGFMDIEYAHQDTIWRSLRHCEGYRAAQPIVPYPPGIPYVLQGEVITDVIITSLMQYIKDGGKIHGVYNDAIRVYE